MIKCHNFLQNFPRCNYYYPHEWKKEQPTIPLPLFFTVVTSVIIAVEIVTFPLHKPPMILAITKMVKFHEHAHTAYETNTPT